MSVFFKAMWGVFVPILFFTLTPLFYSVGNTLAGEVTGEAVSAPQIEKKIAELKKKTAEHDLVQNAALAAELGITLSDLAERGNRYRALIAAHEKHLSELKKSEGIGREELLLMEKMESLQQKGMLRKPPYSLSFHDGLLGELDVARRRYLALEGEIKSIREKGITHIRSEIYAKRSQNPWFVI